MAYRYEVDPDLEAIQVGQLREAIGWDARLDKYQRILGNTYLCVACFFKGSLVGYVDVVSDGVDDAYVRDLMVHPEHQRQGIGSKLIRMVIEAMRPRGIKMLSVILEPDQADFYRQAGFHIMAGGEMDFEQLEL